MTALPRAPIIGSRWEFTDRAGKLDRGRVVYELTGEDVEHDPTYRYVLTVVEVTGSYTYGSNARKPGDSMHVEDLWFEHRTDARRIA